MFYAGKRRNGPGAIALIVVLTITPVILLFAGCYLLKRKSRKSFRSMLRENCMSYKLNKGKKSINPFLSKLIVSKLGLTIYYFLSSWSRKCNSRAIAI
jgi:hypothetical protein